MKNADFIGNRMVFLAANLCSSAHSFIFILFNSLFFDKSIIFAAFNELVHYKYWYQNLRVTNAEGLVQIQYMALKRGDKNIINIGRIHAIE